MSATQMPRPVTARSSMTRLPVGTISSASATVAPSRQGQPEDPPVRGVPAREQVHGVLAEHGVRAVVGDVGQQPPVPAVGSWRPHEDLPLAAVTLLHPVHQPVAVGGGGQEVLRDELVGDSRWGSPAGRPLRRGRGTRPAAGTRPGSAQRVYQKPGPVVPPGHRPAHQVHVRDRLADGLAARDVEHVQRAVLGAVLGQRHRDLPSVRGRDEPVDRRLARRVDRFRVDERPARRSVSSRSVERHQERPLPRRLLLQGEVACRRPTPAACTSSGPPSAAAPRAPAARRARGSTSKYSRVSCLLRLCPATVSGEDASSSHR